jgi:nucleoside-diphosphate-sugar epimerase
MRVLLLGATGKFGSRILPALIHRGHTVTALVRDPSRLPPGIPRDRFSYELGDAKKATDIKAAATNHQCDAIINAAGVAAVSPWGHSDLPTIIDAIVRATLELGRERGKPLRLWVTAGMGLLDLPTQKYMLVD